MQTLVLSQSFEPVKIVSWQRAITLLFLGKVEVVEEYDRGIGCTAVIKVPSVVRLLHAFRRVKKPVKFSRVNIYGRDKFRCQYCGISLKISEGTYDHVLPRAQGGRTNWENIVTACGDCNAHKGNRTPEAAGMKLLSKPVRPEWVPVMMVQFGSTPPEAWRDYIYWTGELDQS